jgi:hypothetical protein
MNRPELPGDTKRRDDCFTGRQSRPSAVLVCEEDGRAIEESLFLNSIPGITESIRAGTSTRAGDFSGVYLQLKT